MELETRGPQPEKIRKMFSEISKNYDRANSVMSVGIHHLWRRALVRWSGAQPGDKILDCATGTGDLAFEFKNAVGTSGEVIGTDFCNEMMEPARAKSIRNGHAVEFAHADVMNLPFEANRFDISSISFGIRNVANPTQALRELGRVTRPGGVVMVLEFGQPTVPGFAQIYRFYSENILPKVGGWITGRPEAYQYLQNSSQKFPCGPDFLKLMKEADQFAKVDCRPLSMGIAYLYKGIVKS